MVLGTNLDCQFKEEKQKQKLGRIRGTELKANDKLFNITPIYNNYSANFRKDLPNGHV